MKRVAEACLKRKGNGARNNRVKKHNKDIESMIKERRSLNKERRKERDEDRKAKLWEEYMRKKEEIRKAVDKLMKEEEEQEFQRLKGCKDKEIWGKINRMLGKEKKKQEVKVMEKGKVLEKEEAGKVLVEFWENLYWSKEKVEMGTPTFSKDTEDAKEVEMETKMMKEHGYAKNKRPYNGYGKIDGRSVEKALKNMKNGKAPGLSGITAEM